MTDTLTEIRMHPLLEIQLRQLPDESAAMISRLASLEAAAGRTKIFIRVPEH